MHGKKEVQEVTNNDNNAKQPCIIRNEKSQNVMYLDKTLLSIDFENVLAFKGEREGLQSFGVVAAGREG
jgi:hypothetical protein